MRFAATMIIGILGMVIAELWLVIPFLQNSDWSPQWAIFSLLLFALAASGLICKLAFIGMERDWK